MPIFIQNSLTHKKEELVLLTPQEVKMYVCGPTVYDEPHIGHARSAYIFDVIRRYLIYKGYKVTFVRNVTDVDDKIIDKAKKEFSAEDLNKAVEKVSGKYLDAYHEDMKSLGILEPDVEPKATEYVSEKNPAMQRFIEQLILRGCAYVSDGDVYFDVKKAKDYGKLSGQSLEKMEVGARIAIGEKKRDPLDFALWKAAKEGEPFWMSPWGKGRPGWHIECSVMSSDILGDEFDIHGGGLDLIFPHHENEIAQSEGAGKRFARYWIHHGLLTINGQKMAKSAGNFVTIKDFIKKYRETNLLKLFFLSAHYAHPIDYTEEKIEEASQAFERIFILLQKIQRKLIDRKSGLIREKNSDIENIKAKFMEAMDDDFNTPKAMAVLFDLVTLTNKNIDESEFLFGAHDLLFEWAEILGLELKKIGEKDVLSPADESLIQKRKEAKKSGNFQEADQIRKQLEEKGIILEDTKDGKTIWRRKL